MATGRQQAVRYHARSRTRGFRDVRHGLSRNRLISLATTAPGNYFSPAALRQAPITLHTRVKITGVTPTGALFHFGTAAHGIACWIDGGSLFAIAGSVAAPAADGVLAEATFEPVVGNVFDVDVACNPGTGVLGVFLDGVLVREQSADPSLLLSAWAAAGGVGEWNRALSAAPAMVTEAGAPTQFSLVLPLSLYHRQRPRHLITERTS